MLNSPATQDFTKNDEIEVCSNIEGLALNASDSATGVTTFVDEACTGISVEAHYVKPSTVTPQEDLQNVKEYFRRPRLIKSGIIPFGTRGQLTDLNIDSPFAMTLLFPQWKERLSGVYGVKFTMKFTLQVAATAFHQGVLAMGFQYGFYNDKIFDRTIQSASLTNLPHVRLNLESDTMVELSVPFKYCDEYMCVEQLVSQTSFGYGKLGVNVLLPSISVTGLSPATYKLYAHLEDIEIFGADNYASSTVIIQSGGKVSNEIKKPSDALFSAAKITRFVSRGVPSLSSIAGPASWVLDTAGGVARYFGYSRPAIQDAATKMLPTYYGSDCHVDSATPALVVTPFQSNSLSVTPEFGFSDVDEMSSKFITSQYSQLCVGAVSTGDAHGDAIYATRVSPQCFWFRAPANKPYCNKLFPRSSADLVSQSGNVFLPTSVMNYASNFRGWRGGYKFKFTFAKTAMHGGRYLLSFNPNYVQGFTPTSYASAEGPEIKDGLVQPYGYSKIVDIKGDSVVEFTVPFVAPTPNVEFYSSIGSLTLTCIDPLQASSQVTTSVPFMVEVCGDDDFEALAYAGLHFVPHSNGTLYQQSGKVVSTTTNVIDKTIGERFTSVKQIIQVPSWQRVAYSTTVAAPTPIAPWFYYYPQHQLTNAIPASATLLLDDVGKASGAWAQCYAFARGGTDFHAYVTGKGFSGAIVIDQVNTDNSARPERPVDYSTRFNVSGMPRIILPLEGGLHARLPTFSKRMRFHPCHLNSGSIGRLPDTASVFYLSQLFSAYLFTLFNNSATDQVYLEYATSAADDAALACYQGPVPFYIPLTYSS